MCDELWITGWGLADVVLIIVNSEQWTVNEFLVKALLPMVVEYYVLRSRADLSLYPEGCELACWAVLSNSTFVRIYQRWFAQRFPRTKLFTSACTKIHHIETNRQPTCFFKTDAFKNKWVVRILKSICLLQQVNSTLPKCINAL